MDRQGQQEGLQRSAASDRYPREEHPPQAQYGQAPELQRAGGRGRRHQRAGCGPSTTAAAKPSGVDKELEEKARKAEEAEKAKQAAEAQKVAQAKADNCKRARDGKATMDSGIRVARVNGQGEREIMDDDARAAEQKRLQTVIDSDCK
ncbi:DUF4124 domain-containing protein [Variovorax ureilyticus]|uniref:DUF4124 domain-containing protein n=1 Tax=Variovorax ureilyticus TaxID=1836198 RepID=UPI003D670BDF